MTREILERANELESKVKLCETALRFMTHGTMHKWGNNTGNDDDIEYTPCELPEEVCLEIRSVIEKWQGDYENQLCEL